MGTMKGDELNQFLLGQMQKLDRLCPDGDFSDEKDVSWDPVIIFTMSDFFWFLGTQFYNMSFWSCTPTPLHVFFYPNGSCYVLLLEQLRLAELSRSSTPLVGLMFVHQHGAYWWVSTRRGSLWNITVYYWWSNPLFVVQFSKPNDHPSLQSSCWVNQVINNYGKSFHYWAINFGMWAWSQVKRLESGLLTNSLPTDMRKYNGKQPSEKNFNVDGFMAYVYWHLAPCYFIGWHVLCDVLLWYLCHVHLKVYRYLSIVFFAYFMLMSCYGVSRPLEQWCYYVC